MSYKQKNPMSQNFLKRYEADDEKIQSLYQDYSDSINKNIEMSANNLAQSVGFANWQELNVKPESGYQIIIESQQSCNEKKMVTVKLVKHINSETLEFSFNEKL